MKIDEKFVHYEATILLRKGLGVGYRKTSKILKKLGFNLSEDTVHSWLYRNKAPRKTSPLIKALYYGKAWELTLELKEQHPEWGPTKIRKEIKKRIRVWVPEMTVYFWIKKGTKPNITPLRIKPELGYVVGVLMSDLRRRTKAVRC